MAIKICKECGESFHGRADALYCSQACKKRAARNVEELEQDNVKLDEPVTDNFKFRFTIKQMAEKGSKDWDEKKVKERTAKYWYDVPLAAVPIIEEGEPEMPEYMDGRQYFLWKKNGFKMDGESAVIFNPWRKK